METTKRRKLVPWRGLRLAALIVTASTAICACTGFPSREAPPLETLSAPSEQNSGQSPPESAPYPGSEGPAAKAEALPHPRSSAARRRSQPSARILAPPRGDEMSARDPIRIAFSRPMDQGSVEDAITWIPEIDYDTEWNDESNELRILPRSLLAPGIHYDIRISSDAEDQDGNALRAFERRIQRPKLVAAIHPPERLVPPTPLRVDFRYALAPDSLEDARFEPPLEGEWTWDEDGRGAAFLPAAPLEDRAEYRLLTESPPRNPDGEVLGERLELGFQAPSPLLAALPESEAPPPPYLELVFDRPMDRESLAAALRMAPPISGTLEGEGERFRYVPESPLDYSTRYSLTLTTGALDAEGDAPFRAEESWTFRTQEPQRLETFGYGPNLVALTPSGRRRVDVLRREAAKGQRYEIEHSLSALSAEDFARRYALRFHKSTPYGDVLDEPILEASEVGTSWTEIVGATDEAKPGAAEDRGEDQAPADESREESESEDQGEDETTSEEEDAQENELGMRELAIPEDVVPGFYVLGMAAGGIEEQIFLVISPYAGVAKRGKDELLLWVRNHDEDRPAVVDVAIHDGEGRIVAEGRSDERGVARIEIPEDTEGRIALLRGADGSVGAIGLDGAWRSEDSSSYWWGWGSEIQAYPASPRARGFLLTDRPIYRPGQTVNYKAALRQDDDALLDLPAEGTTVTLRIRDARDNTVRTESRATSPLGTLDGTFEIADGAMLGAYALELQAGDEVFRQAFKVEDYRKPDVEVEMRSDASSYVQGDPITVTVQARNFYGQPVPDAEVSLSTFRLEESWDDEDDYFWYETHEDDRVARSDEHGRVTFTLKAHTQGGGRQVDWGSSVRKTNLGLEATVDDGSRQLVSGFTVATVYSAAVLLRTEEAERWRSVRPGEAFTNSLQVEDLRGADLADRAMQVLVQGRWGAAKGQEPLLLDARTDESSYIELACADNTEALQRVLDLLRVHEEQQSFLESPPPGLDVTQGISPITEQPGDAIGPYKLLQQVGEGGMGVVYMAEQKEPVKRRVALKIIKPGMDTRQVIARFEAERQSIDQVDTRSDVYVLGVLLYELLTGAPPFDRETLKQVGLDEFRRMIQEVEPVRPSVEVSTRRAENVF